ncbi:methionine--tRNA ligase, mitochondrial-like [Teleopsis dalmanni]|uniref:methionine--tRNA ligase, mitochondrial-like n=1 Tax=Teleopsis dalmanni TaxID=139649 RepID=UPI0018CD9EA3|nr:methionine--tRNA ligase, mitochondrial-like [Teleopsis dalmanni]
MDAALRLQDELRQLEERCTQHYNENNFYLVVDIVMSTLHAANNFFESARPWELKSSSNKSNKDNSTINTNDNNSGHIENANRLQTIIAMTMDTLRLCGIVLQPIVPVLSCKLLDKLSVPQQQRQWRNLNESFATTTNKTANDAGRLEARSLSKTDAILFQRILQKEIATDNQASKQSQKQKQQQQAKEFGKARTKKEKAEKVVQ